MIKQPVKRVPLAPASASSFTGHESEDDDAALMVAAEPSPWVKASRPVSIPQSVRGEVKFYEGFGALGIATQYTWQEADYLAFIVAGTGQNQRLGRKIRLLRMRVVLRYLNNAESTSSFIFGKWKDQTVAGSDLFSNSGSTRAELCAPNPTCVVSMFDHRGPATAIQYLGGAWGTTPSYGTLCQVFDHSFKKGGMQITYDVAGATLGAYPSLWYCFSESLVNPEFAVNYWFTDE